VSRDWVASFITSPDFPTGELAAPAPYLRTEFEATEGLRRATLHVTALGLIEAHLNGARVGDEVLAPGWTSYDHRLVVSSSDVTEEIRSGANALGVILGQGWAVGRLTWEAAKKNLWSDRPLAFVQLELDYGDRVEIVASHANWRAGTGAVRSDSIYDGEVYDARLEPLGWAEPGFDDGDWPAAVVVDRSRDALVSPMAPPIRRTEELPAVSVLTTPQGHTVVDFGQVLTGWVRLRVTGSAGAALTLRHCETLIGGEPDFTTNRTAQATDSYTLRGEGPEEWEPRFTFHGFRYVVVEGWPGQLDPAALTAIVVHSDMARTGWFECSNELVNQLHRNVVWSMRGNFVGVPTDCPQRDERLGWTGDINAFGSTAAYLYDCRAVLGSWLVDLAAEQAVTGLVPFVVPDAMRSLAPPTALWGDVAISLPWQLYREYGDVEALARQYPSMVRFLESVLAVLPDNGLWTTGFQFGDWVDPDAPPDNPGGGKTRPHVMGAAYLCRTTREIAEAAEVLGQDDDAKRFRAVHERVRAAFRHEWVTPAGLLVNETATAYSLAICFDIFEADQEMRAGERLAEIVAEAGYRISTGFAGTPLVAHALSRTGQLKAAYKLLLQTECPSFLYPVTQGATTIWERWDAIKPDGTLNDTGMTSLNHYALGAIADWLHRVVGGLTAVEPGYRTMRISPQPGDALTFATTAHETRYGRIEVTWRRESDDDEHMMKIDVVIPDGTTAEVVLPNHPDGVIEQVGPGEHSWRYAVPKTQREILTLDTPMRAIQEHPTVSKAVWSVLVRHVPMLAEYQDSALSGGQSSGYVRSLRDMLQMFPDQRDALEADLQEVLMSGAAAD
jgi:alpha-L-rhamnosidase